VKLAVGREQRVVAGHLWVFAGEIQEVTGHPQPGDLVDLSAVSGRFCGRGLFNPHSKIRVRLLTFRDEAIDEHFWTGRLAQALALRKRVVTDTTAYRLVYGEGDLLPGLIVDRYADLLVMQALAFGMDRRKEWLGELLTKLTGVKAIYLRHDAGSRTLEGLPMVRGFLAGEHATTVEINEGRARFLVDVEHGQKTGWFCDQRENRLATASLAPGAEVLEVFCHTGAFGIQAARHGAQAVLGLDSSAEAVAMAHRHAELNGLGPICRYRQADAFQELPKLERKGARYDLVILDPPAFAKSRRAAPQALAGYKEINLRAMRLLRPYGFLVTCSCSHHVSEPLLWQTILQAARDAKKQVRLIEARSQARDHPVLAAMPETRYLKCYILQVF
jgi:23S rRNA (cytosine1962-C5)-methyltransferase